MQHQGRDDSFKAATVTMVEGVEVVTIDVKDTKNGGLIVDEGNNYFGTGGRTASNMTWELVNIRDEDGA